MLVNVGYKWYTTSIFFPLWIPYFLRCTVYASFKYYWFSHLVILCFFIVLLLSHLCMSFVSIYFISCFILEAVCSSSVLFCFISPACCLDCVQLPHLFLLLLCIYCVSLPLSCISCISWICSPCNFWIFDGSLDFGLAWLMHCRAPIHTDMWFSRSGVSKSSPRGSASWYFSMCPYCNTPE